MYSEIVGIGQCFQKRDNTGLMRGVLNMLPSNWRLSDITVIRTLDLSQKADN